MTPRKRKSAIALPAPDPLRFEQATTLAERAPAPAAFRNVRFGTAGWTDKTLIDSGLFYPRRSATPEERLRFYAAHFPLVEVDAPYYSLLPPEMAERWVSWTPQSFCFDVKAFPVFTGHPIDIARLPPDLRAECQALGHERRVYPDKLPDAISAEIRARFLRLLEPLIEARRFGALFLQFPPWFTATEANVRKLEGLRRALPNLEIAIEFRHASWVRDERRDRVLALLRAERMSYVCVDEPDRMPALTVVTNPSLAVVRFHGKNRAGWNKRGASVHERFDYLYGPDELAAWVDPVQRLSSEAEVVHAVFNNCVRNYAVLNAKDLAVLLGDAGAPRSVPEHA